MAITARSPAGRQEPGTKPRPGGPEELAGSGELGSSSTTKWLVLGVAVMGTFMSVLDATVVNIALPKLMAVFSADVHLAEWVLTGYLLALASTIPVTGFLTDRYGSKRMYMVTVWLFTIGSALCAAAWNIETLIIFRILQGLGGGMIQPLAMSIVLRAFTPRERGMAMSVFGIPVMLAPVLGPTLGGYLIEHVDWRTVFTINIPVGILAIAAAKLVLKETPLQRGQRLDVIGLLLVSLGTAILLLGIANAPVDGWGDPYVVVEIALGLVMLLAFIVVELQISEPLLDLRLFGSLSFSTAISVTLVLQVCVFGGMFLLPLFLQNLRGMGPTETGMMLVPQALSVAATMPLAGWLFARVGPAMLITPGMIAVAFATYKLGTLSMDMSDSSIMLLLALRGAGMGLTFMPATTAAMNSVALQKMARATGMTNALQRICASFGTAVMATLLQTRQDFHYAMLSQLVTPNSRPVMQLMGRMKTAAEQHAMTALQAKHLGLAALFRYVQQTATILSFQDAFLITSAICVPGIIAALFVRDARRVQPGGPAAATIVE